FGEPRFHAADTPGPADNEGEAVSTATAGPNQTMFLHNQIKLNVFDVEVTQAVNAGKWMMLTSGGVRFVQLQQYYNALARNTVPNAINNDLEGLASANTVDAIGPTVGLEVRRPLGDCGFALYGTARGAILFADRKTHADFRHTDFTGTLLVQQTFDHESDVV